MTTYPCPFCGGQADLEAGCSACGRAPFPDAAEVVRLGARADELLVEVEAARAELDEARRRYDAAVQRLNAVRAQRNLLAARVSQTVQAAKRALAKTEGATPAPVRPVPAPQQLPAGPVPAPGAGGLVAGGPGVQGPAPVPVGQPEASPRTVQNLLFILGGLLLGSAAIVFTAVAWASFGVLGRAAILATVTLITLAVPPVALARGLRSTAETFAALGLLLVLLDGYAAWYVNLAGLADTTRPRTYAGLVLVVTAVVAGGYAVATGLRGPRFAAILAAQPALPLLAAERSFGATGWTLTFVAVAALDLLLARAVEKAAWVGAGLAVVVAGPLGLVALSTVDGVAGVLGAGAAMLSLAAVIVAASLMHRVTAHVGAGIAVGIVALVAVRILAELVPDHQVVAFACVPVLIALAVVVLPERVRAGARVGAFVVAGTAAVPYAYAALFAAGSAVDRALPAWHGPVSTLESVFSWQVPVALLPVAAAFLVLSRSRWVVWPAVVLIAFAVPGAFDAPLPVVSVLDFAVLAGLAVAALHWSARHATAPAPATVPAAAGKGQPPTDAAGPAPTGPGEPAAGPDGSAPTSAAPTGPAEPGPGPANTTWAHPSGAEQPTSAEQPGAAGQPVSAGPGVAGRPVGAGQLGFAPQQAWVSPPAGWWAAMGLPVVAVHMVFVGLDTPLATLLTMAGLVAVCVLIALLGGTERLAAPAVAVGLAGMPLLVAAAVRLAGSGGTLSVPAPMFGAAAGLALATVLVVVARARFGTPGVFGVTVAGLGATLTAVGLSTSDGGHLPFGVFAAAAVLSTWFVADAARRPGTGDGAPPSEGPAPAWLVPAVLPAVIPAIVALLAVGPAVFEALLRPYRWLGAVWQGAPDGVGLDPTGRWWAGEAQAFGPGPAAVALGLLAVLAVLVGRRTRTAVWTLAGAPATLAVVLGCLAAEAPWPTVPAVTLAGGLVTALAAALVRPEARALRVNVGAFTCWFTAGAGFAGCLATKPATLSALAAVLVTAAVVGVAGRTAPARILGWLVGALSAGWLTFTAARAAELPLRWTGYWVLLAAAVVLATAVVIRRLRPVASAVQRGAAPGEALVLEVVAHATAVVAFLLTSGDLAAMAGISSLWGLVLGLRALTGGPRVAFAGAAGAAQLVAYWLVLASNEVALLEAYTLPAGAIAAAVGWYAARGRAAGQERLSSWVAYGPALFASFGPSLASVLVSEGEPVRRLLLGLGALAVVIAGAVLRLQAPAIVGGSVLTVIALHEIAVYWDLLPRWAPLAVAGLVLVALATTYERRIRDVRRLRAAVTRMR
ncbi:hypothetical protein AB0K00_48835 [Dactylosporangium sp. NPDC049525]|uniref:SCO7613 C-terminal domain-containing membrane protein n=1 Tax=Dactylosporangium sp. NPDC049525 TaxID=3154730 RepID=UPI003421713B